ncbi:MAG: hypothetical protein BECKG1743D_GA0114223_102461, partial [Candidatus Kentron sp. G]
EEEKERVSTELTENTEKSDFSVFSVSSVDTLSFSSSCFFVFLRVLRGSFLSSVALSRAMERSLPEQLL